MDSVVVFGGRTYFLFLALLVVARGFDFLSTWIATPNLLLEANPIARKLGWRGGLALNAGTCLVFAMWPVPAMVIMTASVLVAARNFQSAWLMCGLGEAAYRAWLAERVSESRRGLFLFCLGAQGVLLSGVGVALIRFSGWQPVPFAIGTGFVAYAGAVVIFTLLAVWRVWRAPGPDQ